jgi:hypothetical protein
MCNNIYLSPFYVHFSYTSYPYPLSTVWFVSYIRANEKTDGGSLPLGDNEVRTFGLEGNAKPIVGLEGNAKIFGEIHVRVPGRLGSV